MNITEERLNEIVVFQDANINELQELVHVYLNVLNLKGYAKELEHDENESCYACGVEFSADLASARRES